MKKLIFLVCVLWLGGVFAIGTVKRETQEHLQELTSSVVFDTTFDLSDFEDSANISRKYSNDVGLPEVGGL